MYRHAALFGVLALVLVFAFFATRVPPVTPQVQPPEHIPVARNGSFPPPLLLARAYYSAYIDRSGGAHVLASSMADKPLPLASISKLMTALVAEDRVTASDTITLSKADVTLDGASGLYSAGERMTMDAALHALLIASHNDVANAIAEKFGTDTFVETMNQKAAWLGLASIHFVNPSGLDPRHLTDPTNIGSATDIAKLLLFLYKHKPDLFSILGQTDYPLRDADGRLIATITSTDALLGPDTASLIVLGGKTGETERAGQNLAIISRSPSEGIIVSVVLGSTNRFADMKVILGYDASSFDW